MSGSESADIKRLVADGAGPFTDGPRVVTVARRIPATPAEIFDAWRDPAIMKQWYFPGPDWSSEMVHDFETGGRYHLEMIHAGGDRYVHSGEYREITPFERIVFSWSTPFVKESLVTVTLRPLDGDTEITLRHEFPAGINVEMPGLHEVGWTGTLQNMSAYFSD